MATLVVVVVVAASAGRDSLAYTWFVGCGVEAACMAQSTPSWMDGARG